MGFLRLILALSVVLGHVGFPDLLVGGRNAVQMFYLISGFLISYVLVEREAYSSSYSFYVNRFLRLYPIYMVVAIASLVGIYFLKFRPEFLAPYLYESWAAKLILIVSNILIFGQDWLMFLRVEDGQLGAAVDFKNSDVELWRGLIVPQAWTLGVEMSFYLLAPLLLKRMKMMLMALMASLLVRVVLLASGVGLNDPWDYRFFPAELSLFLIGALSHQVLSPLYRRWFSEENLLVLGWGCVVGLIALIVAFPVIPLGKLVKSLMLFSLFVPMLPLLFRFQSASAWDRRIGELSYPIYIGHWLVIDAVLATGMVTHAVAFAATVLACSVLLAFGLNRWAAEPVERLRQRWRG